MFLRSRNKLYGASALLILILGVPTFASAGAKIKVDDTKWFSVGMGFRSSITVTEDGADNGTDAGGAGVRGVDAGAGTGAYSYCFIFEYFSYSFC